MNKIFLLICISFALAGCSKKQDIKPILIPRESITISGNAYTTVIIGKQTWTSVNYNGPGGANYDDTTVNDPLYGKLYTLAEAKAITLPSGWRIPNATDYNQLLQTIGVTVGNTGTYTANESYCDALMSKANWVYNYGTNTSGFTAIPSGLYQDGYNNQGNIAAFLTTTFDPVTQSNGWFFIIDSEQFALIGMEPLTVAKVQRGSLRFVKDN